MNTSTSSRSTPGRFHYLDAVRAFALILGIFYHGALSFMPWAAVWAVQDVSTHNSVSAFIVVCHSFRLELFFLIAGLFSAMTLERRSLPDFVKSRLIRIGIPFVVGWFLLKPWISAVWIAGWESMRGEIHFWNTLKMGFMSIINAPGKLLVESHLWFLYYLLLITGIVLLTRIVVNSIPKLQSWGNKLTSLAAKYLLGTYWGIAILSLLTAIALWNMNGWGVDTPDRSLVPHIPVLLVYLGCFGSGWILWKTQRIHQLPDSIWIFGIQALISLAIVLGLSSIQSDVSHPSYQIAKIAYSVGYAFLMWSLVFLTLKLFRALFKTENRWVRFVADSSYWMYLIHLPIVVALQILVAEWPLSWIIKWPFITSVTIAISIITYDLFVRSTPVGWVLNGRKQPRFLLRAS